MSRNQAEDIANGARDFAETEFGRWFIAELERRADNHMRLAQGSDAHNITVNAVMRAAGVREAIEIITINKGIAESNTFKKK